MAGSGFQVEKSRVAGPATTEKIKGAASTQYTLGDMLNFFGSGGIATKVTATGKGTHIVQAMITPDNMVAPVPPTSPSQNSWLTTTAGEMLETVPVYGGQVELSCDLTGDGAPTVNGLALNANATLNQAVMTLAGANNDYTLGTAYVPEIGQQRFITADAQAGGVKTITVDQNFRRAPTVGDTIIMVPFSQGTSGVKFNPTSPQQCLDTTVAGKAGGTVVITGVSLKRKKVFFICPDLK